MPPEQLPLHLAPSEVGMSMAAPYQHPSSQAPLSLVALRLSSLYGQQATYAVELERLGRQEPLGSHSSCPSSCLLSNSSLLYPLLLGSLDTPTPPRGMAHCPEGPCFHATKSLVCCLLCQECYLPASPSGRSSTPTSGQALQHGGWAGGAGLGQVGS